MHLCACQKMRDTQVCVCVCVVCTDLSRTAIYIVLILAIIGDRPLVLA